jgi:alkylation response protein AidB-like acyl-CoA dehydrogenase
MEDLAGYSPELWQKITELGWAGLMFPEQYGGSGYTFVELCVLMEEFGRALLPSPFHATVLTLGLPILAAAAPPRSPTTSRPLRRARISARWRLRASASFEPSGISVRAVARNGGFVIDGTKLFVANAPRRDTAGGRAQQ